MINRKALTNKAKEILQEAYPIMVNTNDLPSEEKFWSLYSDFLRETNFKWKDEGLNAFKVACLTERRAKLAETPHRPRELKRGW